jgi:hypothetical protein
MLRTTAAEAFIFLGGTGKEGIRAHGHLTLIPAGAMLIFKQMLRHQVNSRVGCSLVRFTTASDACTSIRISEA